MSEMELTADRLVIVGRGRLVADTSVDELAERYARGVLVRSPRAAELRDVLTSAGAAVAVEPDAGLSVTGLDVARIGDLAAAHGIPVYEVTPRRASLEEAYMELTAESVEFAAGAGSAGARVGAAAKDSGMGTTEATR